MRALAEFVMRGRAQAIGVVAIGVLLPLFPWVGIAAAALVALRKGGTDAVIVLGWGLLAAFTAFWLWGDITPVAALVAMAASAVTLRWSSSWVLALVVLSAVCLVAASLLNLFGDTYVNHWVALWAEFQRVLVKLQPDLSPEAVAEFIRTSGGGFNAAQVSGGVGARAVVFGFTSLVLGRYWQGLLYNPGGFGLEFRQLRLPPLIVLALIGLGAVLLMAGTDYGVWLQMAILPIVAAGLALVHGMATLKGWTRAPLVTMYMALFFLSGPTVVVLFLLATIDSWVDFRGRFRANTP
jgi:hypothetical protein